MGADHCCSDDCWSNGCDHFGEFASIDRIRRADCVTDGRTHGCTRPEMCRSRPHQTAMCAKGPATKTRRHSGESLTQKTTKRCQMMVVRKYVETLIVLQSATRQSHPSGRSWLVARAATTPVTPPAQHSYCTTKSAREDSLSVSNEQNTRKVAYLRQGKRMVRMLGARSGARRTRSYKARRCSNSAFPSSLLLLVSRPRE